jgi:hypothetical protein
MIRIQRINTLNEITFDRPDGIVVSTSNGSIFRFRMADPITQNPYLLVAHLYDIKSKIVSVDHGMVSYLKEYFDTSLLSIRNESDVWESILPETISVDNRTATINDLTFEQVLNHFNDVDQE